MMPDTCDAKYGFQPLTGGALGSNSHGPLGTSPGLVG
jgi:hypothetical protein